MLLTLKVLNILSKCNVDRKWHWLEFSFYLYSIKTTVKDLNLFFGEEKSQCFKKHLHLKSSISPHMNFECLSSVFWSKNRIYLQIKIIGQNLSNLLKVFQIGTHGLLCINRACHKFRISQTR